MLQISRKANIISNCSKRWVMKRKESLESTPPNQNSNIINKKLKEKYEFIQKCSTDVKSEAGLRFEQV